MNGFDLSTISNCYYGQSACSAIYLGSTKIWPTTPAHDYSQDYFTIVSTSNNNSIYLYTSNTSYRNRVYVSTNGTNWVGKIPNISSGYILLGTLNNGDKLYLRGTSAQYATSSYIYHYLTASGNFEVEGNIMSLIYEDNFVGQTSLSNTYNFYKFFYNNTYLTNAEHLVLPATTATNYCYSYMFNGCTALTKAPALPATTVTNYCYLNMFDGCTALTKAPALPATTLAQSCYSWMFYRCTSMTTVPTTLPATTLANQCYNRMFSGCTALTKAPALPATTLTPSCYNSMFTGCTSLTNAPELPATTLANYCYGSMFSGCTSLNYIKCLATNISATSCTSNWLNNVAATGTFVKDANMAGWSTGSSGIPDNWTIQNA